MPRKPRTAAAPQPHRGAIDGVNTCGRPTRRCRCQHAKRDHKDGTGPCSAKTGKKRDGPPCTCEKYENYPCGQPAMDNGACKHHGGKNLKGPAHPAFTHGGHSKYLPYLPKDLGGQYLRALKDPTLATLNDELAIVELRIADLLGRMTNGHAFAANRYKDLKAAWIDFRAAVNRGDMVNANAKTAVIAAMLDAGAQDMAVQAELVNALDLKRRLARDQAQILKDTHQMISLAQVLLVIAQTVDSIKRRVTNPTEVSAVVEDLQRLLGPGVNPAIDA